MSELETIIQKKNRIAIENGVLPEYISLFNGETIFLKDQLDFDLNVIEENNEFTLEEKTKKRLKDLSETWNLPETIIVLEYIKKNRSKLETALLPFLLKDYETADYQFNSASEINRSLNNYDKYLQDKLETLKKTVDDISGVYKILEKASPIKFSKFVQDSNIVEIIAKRIDPYELFNDLIVEGDLQAMKLSFHNGGVYYKINSELKGDALFREISENLREPISKKIPDYATINIYYTFENTVFETRIEYPNFSEIMVITIETHIEDRTRVVLLENKLNLTELSRKDKGVKGDLAIENFNVNREIFLELINDPEISKLFYVDESNKIGSRKDKKGVKAIYLIYDPTGEDLEQNQIRGYLSQKVSSRSDKMFKNDAVDLYSNYLNVRITKAPDEEIVKVYSGLLSRLLGLYKKRSKTIENEYKKYTDFQLPKLEKPRKEILTNIQKLRLLKINNRFLFTEDYARDLGTKDKQVRIYDETNPDHLARKNEVFIFPKDTGFKFICEKGYRPGLVKNKQINKREYPYLPACYKNNNDKFKLWKDYTAGKPIAEKPDKIEKKGDPVSLKAIEFFKDGLLPRNVSKLLGPGFLRTGVPIDQNSFIGAVMLAMDPEYAKQRDKQVYAQNFRENLPAQPKQYVKQELWDYTDSQIDSKLLSDDPFDSRIFIGYLENIYNCKIYVFSRLKDVNATFEIPRFTQAGLYDNRKKNVFIYKHMGTEADHLETPHYELIYDSESNKKVFKSKDPVVKKVRKYFEDCYEVSVFPGTIKPKKVLGITAQYLDSFGKVRGLNFGEITMYTSPLSPSLAPSDNPFENNPVSLETAESFVENSEAEIIRVDTKENRLIGVLTNIYDYSYIPVVETAIPDRYSDRIGKDLSIFPEKEPNILEEIKNVKKIANFLMQFAIYSFSQDFDPNLEIKEQINDFRTVIKPENDYLENLERKMTMNNNFFEDSVLIVDSETTDKKIRWFLEYITNFNRRFVDDYKNKEFLDNFYTKESDFKQSTTQLVFIGNPAFFNWLTEGSNIFENLVVYSPDPKRESVQFFWNWVFGRTVLFQNVRNGELGRAFNVSKTFNKKGYNLGFEAPGVDLKEIENYKVYSFVGGVLVSEGTEGTGENLLFRYENCNYAAILN